MSDMKILGLSVGSMVVTAFLLVIGVWAHDRHVENCAIDHLFDFHLDYDHVMEDVKKDTNRKELERRMEERSLQRQQQWADDIRDWGHSGSAFDGNDVGTFSKDDRDCNRDRD